MLKRNKSLISTILLGISSVLVLATACSYVICLPENKMVRSWGLTQIKSYQEQDDWYFHLNKKTKFVVRNLQNTGLIEKVLLSRDEYIEKLNFTNDSMD